MCAEIIANHSRINIKKHTHNIMFKKTKNKDVEKILEAAREKKDYTQQIKINFDG